MKTYYKTFAEFWAAVCEAQEKVDKPVHHWVELTRANGAIDPLQVLENNVPLVVKVEYLRKVEGNAAPIDGDALKLYWQTLRPVALRWEKGWVLLRAGARAVIECNGKGDVGFPAEDVIDESPPRRIPSE
jgi:hypothetical protein